MACLSVLKTVMSFGMWGFESLWLRMLKTFVLQRNVDISGVSGTGIVADGVLWQDGTCTIRWRGEHPSIAHWQDIEHAKQIHGHGGHTLFVFDE